MTVPARVKEADMMRAVRTAKKLGALRVSIDADGRIEIILKEGQRDGSLPVGQPDQPRNEIKTIW